MTEILNVDQIKARYPSEWVLIGDPEETDTLEVMGGRVLFHSASAEELYRKAAELRPGKFATLYTGDTPADMEYAL